MTHPILQIAAALALIAPWMAFCIIGLLTWFRRPFGERATTTITGVAFAVGVLSAVAASVTMAVYGVGEYRVNFGTWIPIEHNSLTFELVLDRLSLPFATFGAVLVGIVGAFSRRYLHREAGFVRFYLLLALLGGGFELVVLAGSLGIVLLGWELVGVTSALLIAFFHHRVSPVRHGLRAFVTYRVCDIALISAVVWLHHAVGSTGFSVVGANWAGPALPSSALAATAIGLLLLFATMGKSAQVPVTGWLPRAMEGPTPSSAVFYGALSIHLGPYLLLRTSSFIDSSTTVAVAVFVVGLLTVLHASFVGRVQTDIKSALAYASAGQVGLIFMEIALGLRFLAIVHIVGHAAIRTLQILRSPSLLHDYHHLEQAMARQLPRTGRHLERLFPARLQPWLYRAALERGYFDSLLHDYVAAPLGWLLRGIDALEQRWTTWLGRGRPESSDQRPELTTSAEVIR
ncbi:proton-conducting transporter membrane subunit [Haliangium sp.]|uniref:proton-conducting transporter transmembrane domain-containing protein n=1 Tax=Haliangium sp. TaxID=2663208 RepID=UPI003D0987FF